MKKLFSILLALMIPLFAAASASADDLYLIGDADGDSELTILDATHIQRALAGLSHMNALRGYLSDVDGSGDPNILDATHIQRRLAGIGNAFYKDVLIPWQARIDSIEGDTAGGAVIVGSEVRFDIIAPEREIPTEYEVYVNGLRILSRCERGVFSYTFDHEGLYNISAVAYDPFGGSAVHTISVRAAAEPAAPEIIYAAYIPGDGRITVQASGGTAPYEYQYTIRNNITPPAPGEVYVAEFDFDYDENGEPILRCRYCTESEVYVPTYMLSRTLSYFCEIQVRGADGAVSQIKKVRIIL